MKVYVATWKDAYGYNGLVGVYTDKDRAEKEGDKFIGENGGADNKEVDIEECFVDEPSC